MKQNINDKPLTSFQKFLAYTAALRKTHFDKLFERYQDERVQIGVVKTGKFKTNALGQKYEVIVPVTQFIGTLSKNKYNHKQLEKKRVEKMLALHRKSGDNLRHGPDKFLDGTPIDEGRLVALW